jgi:outer membrane protein assembly factor BamB
MTNDTWTTTLRWTGLAVACAGSLIVGATLQAQEWPGWRGPDRDGVVRVAGPQAWPETLTPRWKVTVGEGYASPLFVGGRILQFARQGDDEVAMAIDPASGRILWRQAYPATSFEPISAAERHGKGPKSTPVHSDGMLYTFGATGVLSAFDAASGAVAWRHDHSKEFGSAWPMFGNSMSPVAGEGLVVALVGTNDDGAIVAYDARSGARRWIWRGDGPGYGSPLIVELDGVKQVVTFTQQYLVGLALESGELLWQSDFPARQGMNIPTPLVLGQGQTILAGTAEGTSGLRVTRTNNRWATGQTWQNGDIALRLSSPVRKDDLVFGFTSRNSGAFFALDARNGRTLWMSDPRQGDNAAILVAGDHLLLLKDSGELIVARATATDFEPVRRYQVADSATYAHPLMLPTGIVVKDATTLALLGWE